MLYNAEPVAGVRVLNIKGLPDPSHAMGALFGTSGMRGIVNLEITPHLVLKTGMALAESLDHSGSVAVGTDHRTSAEAIKRAMVAGILAGGCHVMDVGLAPTPTIVYAGSHLGCDASVSITASHNPPEYNGIKLWNPDGSGFSREQEADVEERILGAQIPGAEWNNVGRVFRRPHASYTHIDAIIAALGHVDGFSVVYDGGCGAGSKVTPYLLRELGCKVFTLNSVPDGRFNPRDHIRGEPLPAAGDWNLITDLANLVDAVSETEADIGLANDGDADRILVVDETGTVVPPDVLIAFFAEQALKENKGGTIITTVDASMLVEEVAKKNKGKVVRTPVGDVFVSRAAKEHSALLGAEPAGTFIFPDLHLCPDGPFSAARAVRVLAEHGKPLSEILAVYERYPMGRLRLECPKERKATAMDAIGEELEDVLSGVKGIDTVDGIRAELKGGWILVRPSGTEPILRITAEARDQKALDKTLEAAQEAVGEIIARVTR